AACLHHRVERLALVLQVALDRLDQVRDQVVAAPELDVDLRERVLEAVAQHDQAIVDRDRPDDDHDDDPENDPAHELSPPAPTITYPRRAPSSPRSRRAPSSPRSRRAPSSPRSRRAPS